MFEVSDMKAKASQSDVRRVIGDNWQAGDERYESDATSFLLIFSSP